MKRVRTQIIYIVLGMVFFSCYEKPKKIPVPEPPKIPGIYYAETGNFGENILSEQQPSSRILDPAKSYSLFVEIVGNDDSARIIMPQTSSFTWSCSEEPPPSGWNTIIRINSTMLFMAKGEGIYECKLLYYGTTSSGSGEIKIYENNSATPNRVVTVLW